MKMIKMALLGGAALAVTAAGAQADELADLKAQIESLNARMAQMEAAPSVPAGYSLLTLGEAQATVVPGFTRQEQSSFDGQVNTISVLPTADAPAAAVIEWSGLVRAILGYVSTETDFDDPRLADTDDDDLSVYGRGRLNMTARTDTAVGEVGVRLRLEGNGSTVDNDYPVEMEIAWGWWAMTPELTLGGGYNGSLGSIGFGYDGACTCHFIDNANVYEREGDATQMRLSYASGPFSAGIALEDGSDGDDPGIGELEGVGEALRVAGEIAYAGDTFSGEISGLYVDDSAGNDGYNVGIGLGFSLDPVALSMAAGIGNTVPGDADYWFVNALASMNLSDEIHAELGAGYKNYEDGDVTVMGIMAGIYYQPVDQLTIGLEAEYVNTDVDNNFETDDFYAGLVTVYSF